MVKDRIGKMKTRKQGGPDGIRSEMLRALMDSEVCMEKMALGFNEVLETGIVVDGWKQSKTCMIPKVRKPGEGDHRPIALTNAGYKLFMGVLKDQMVGQVMMDGRIGYMQAGFTEGRRMTENIFLLGLCVEEKYRKDKT